MSAELLQVIQKLDVIKTEIDYIKEHMVDIDTILTPDEESRLNESLKEFKQGKTTSLQDFEREMKENVKHRTR